MSERGRLFVRRVLVRFLEKRGRHAVSGDVAVGRLELRLWFKARERSGAAAEFSGFNAEVLEHGDVEVTEWGVVVGAEGQVLAVLEAAASEQDGEVRIQVRV